MARTAAKRRNHGDLRSHRGRCRNPRRQTGVKKMATLTGKTAVVTGSTSGIRAACAQTHSAPSPAPNTVPNARGPPAAIEKDRAGIETDSKVKAVHSPADMT